MHDATREQFLAQRSPRRGTGNPEPMDVPLWEWLVHNPLSAHAANRRFAGPDPRTSGPGWSFDRFGCSRTPLPDGRVLHIAGEHEDGYDPDFYIYNDVILRSPDGGVQVFGYSEQVFPPTDFHSATLVRDHVVILGSLGESGSRRIGQTQAYALALDSLAMRPLATEGEGPGWIHGHQARLAADGRTIECSGGLVQTEAGGLVENHADWSLHLGTLRWRKLRQHPFEQWVVRRRDGGSLLLAAMRDLSWRLCTPGRLDDTGEADRLVAAGYRFDPVVFERLFAPDVPHVVLARDAEDDLQDDLQDAAEDDLQDAAEDAAGAPWNPAQCSVACLRVGDAVVRYHDEFRAIDVRIEGQLPEDTVRRICADLAAKLSQLQDAECEARLVLRVR